jgi:hypothetical protein
MLTMLFVELLAALGLLQHTRLTHRRDLARFGVKQPRRIPVIDKRMEWLAGSPTKFQKRVSKSIIWGARRIVDTRVFEHLVAALVNPDSRLKQLGKRIPIQII